MTIVCYNCQDEIPIDGVVGRSYLCAGCNRPLRCCRNCSFYSPGSHNSCRESSAETVVDKETANFCSCFKPGNDADNRQQKKADAARDQLEKLFD